jgi:hypothetical protein
LKISLTPLHLSQDLPGRTSRETDITTLFESLTLISGFHEEKGTDNVILIQEDNLPERLILKLDTVRTRELSAISSEMHSTTLFQGLSGLVCTSVMRQ